MVSSSKYAFAKLYTRMYKIKFPYTQQRNNGTIEKY